MEKVVGKLLVATGLLISGSVALLPLTSHATSNTGNIFDCNSSLTNPDGGKASNAAGAEAPNPCATSNDGSTQVNVRVQDILAFDADDAAGFSDQHNGDKIIAYPNAVRYGRIYANVRSAKAYTISLSATEDTETGIMNTALVNADGTASIPARKNPSVSVNGWGIAMGQQVELGSIDYDVEYSPLREAPAVFYDGGPNDDFTITNFPVAVSITDQIPQGTYTTDVTITAAVKQ